MKHRAAIVAIGVLALVWGYNWVVIKVATGDAVAVCDHRDTAVSSGRSRCSSSRRSPARPLKSPPIVPTALIGLFQVTLLTTFQTLALATGGAGKTTILVYTFPFWMALLSVAFLDERMTRWRLIAVAVAAIGLGFVLYPLDLGHGFLSKGCALAAALAWAIGSVATKRFRMDHDVDLLSFTAWQMAYGAIPLVVIALIIPGGTYVHVTPASIAGDRLHRSIRHGARVLAVVLHHRTPQRNDGRHFIAAGARRERARGLAAIARAAGRDRADRHGADRRRARDQQPAGPRVGG